MLRDDDVSSDAGKPSKTASDADKDLLNRRECLKLGAAAVAAATGTAAAATGGARATTSRRGVTFDRVVDAVDDLGLDDTGGDAIDAKLLDHVRDGTLVEFPDGEYKIGHAIRNTSVSNFGMVAAEGATPSLVPASPIYDLPGQEVLVQFEGSDILFGGFRLDFTRGADYGGRVQLIAESGDVTVYDMTTHGQLPGDVDGYKVEARSKGGVATVENVNMRDGAVEGPSATGIFVGPNHAGEIHIRDCDVWHFPSKGIYASNPAHPDVGAGGTIHVDGGLYKNNNDCDVRVGSAGSTVKNIVSVKEDTLQGETVTWKNPIPRRHWDGRTDIVQTRSIRLKYGRDVLIEGCEFIHDIGQGAGIITGEGSHAGGTTIRDCRIANDADIYPILLKDGGSSGFSIENVSITGAGGRGAGIRVEDGRDGTVVRNCCLSLTRTDECGVEIFGSRDCLVTDSNVKVDGRAVTFDDSTVETSGLTYTDSCPLPDASDYEAPSDGTDETTQKTLSNTCTVRTTGSDVDYSVTVTDGIVDGSDGNVVDSSSVSNTVSGSLADGQEEWFWFDGEVQSLDLSADAAFYVNGTEVDPAQYGIDETTEPTQKTLSNTCTVWTTGSDVDYSVTVTDGIVDGSDGNVVDPSSVSNTVSGSLADGEGEWFWFDGEVQSLDLSADAAFYINGTEVDPAQYETGGDGSVEPLPNVLVIDGSTYETGAQYEFAVTGDVERDAELSTAPADGHSWDQSEDTIDGNAVTGRVWDGVDAYRFSGTLSRMKVSGNAQVRFE